MSPIYPQMKTRSIPVLCSSCFEWKGNHGTTEETKLIEVDQTSVPESFRGVAIKSKRTGHTMLFNPVYDEDGYDGEFMIYSANDEYFVQIWNY